MKRTHWKFQLDYSLSPFHLAIDLEADSGVLSVFGPSGAGKSTLLELLCGLRRPDHGVITIGERVLFDSARKISIPAGDRRIGWVPQDASLFPHLTVWQNICYGLRPGKTNSEVEHVIEVLNLGHTVARLPSALSGGEKQRVALARALASSPEILLLDEPLGSLDIPLRYKIFPYLLMIRDSFEVPILYVSHDPNEVISIADHVFMLVGGKIVNEGSPAELLAGLRGLNLDGTEASINTLKVRRLGLLPAEGAERVVTNKGLVLTIPLNPVRSDEAGFVTISPHDLILFRTAPDGSSMANVFKGTVTRVDIAGPHAHVHLDSGEALVAVVSSSCARNLGLAPGQAVYLAVAAEHCRWLTTLPPKDPFDQAVRH